MKTILLNQDFEKRSRINAILSTSYLAYASKYPQHNKVHIKKTMGKIKKCRTEASGGQVYKCPEHAVFRIVPHSCHDRFCPLCFYSKIQNWIEDKAELLSSINTPYCFLTFTVPGCFSRVMQENKKLLLTRMFRAVNGALNGWCQKEKNFTPAFVLVMQTSGDRLNYHAHIHLLITCGGIREEKEWVALKSHKREKHRNGKKFHPAFPPQALLKIFKALFYRALRFAYKQPEFVIPDEYGESMSDMKGFNRLLRHWWKVEWNLDISDPLQNAGEVLKYIVRYIKKPPISDRRIVEHNEQTVKFTAWERNYSRGKKQKEQNGTNNNRNRGKEIVTYPATYFVCLLLEHVPLPGFHLIRWGGFFSNRNRKRLLPIAQKLLPGKLPVDAKKEKETALFDWRSRHMKATGIDPMCCPICKRELQLAYTFYPNQLISLKLSFYQLPDFLMQ